MIYAVHKFSKRHRIVEPDAKGKYRASMDERLVQATPDGWIDWQGGECPVPGGARFDVKCRNGDEFDSQGSSRWDHRGYPHDIIAYRPILEKQATLGGAKLWQDAEGTIPCREGDPVGRVGEPPAWDGESWPIPIGTECLFDTPDEYGMTSTWMNAKVVGRDGPACVVAVDGDGYHGSALRSDFRPIRSKKDRAVEEMAKAAEEGLGHASGLIECMTAASGIYCAIRDGKVPGVKLTGGEG